MSRIHGRKGRVYIGIASGAAATPLPFVAKWDINFKTDKADVTAMGDDNKTYVNGLPDPTGSFSGFFDDATAQTYTAAVDGLARNFYLYPTIATTATYFFGSVLPDFSLSSSVDGAVEMSTDWAPAGPIAKVG